jgi:hypothetical protein
LGSEAQGQNSYLKEGESERPKRFSWSVTLLPTLIDTTESWTSSGSGEFHFNTSRQHCLSAKNVDQCEVLRLGGPARQTLELVSHPPAHVVQSAAKLFISF